MATLDGLLRLAHAQSAAELLVRAGEPPALRVRGALRPLSMPTMDAALVRHALDEILAANGADAAASEGELLYDAPTVGRVRVRWKTQERVEIHCQLGASDAPRHGESSSQLGARVSAPASPPTAPATSTPPLTPAVAVAPRAPAHATSMHAHPAHTHAGPNGELARAARWSIDVEASDLVLVDGQPIAAKVHGAMLRQGSPLGEGAVAAMIDEALDGHARARLAEHGSVDLALGIDVPGAGRVRFRCNRFRALAGDSAVLRRISGEPPTLESLDLPPTLSRWAEEPWGLVLVCGPAGSGKSTTLVALVEHLNRTADKHIVTLEDPIEHVFAPKRSVIHQRSIGEHVESFGAGLRAALREAPDVILLGEMRDREAIGAAIVAAETGHLVLATVHAGSAAATIDRMLDVFSEHAQRTVRGQIAEVLRCVIGQRLLPARDGGRVPAVELMPTTAAIGHLIREGKTFQIPQLMQTGRDQGMVPMARSIADRVRSGRVDRATAMRLAPDPAALVDALGGR